MYSKRKMSYKKGGPIDPKSPKVKYEKEGPIRDRKDYPTESPRKRKKGMTKAEMYKKIKEAFDRHLLPVLQSFSTI